MPILDEILRTLARIPNEDLRRHIMFLHPEDFAEVQRLLSGVQPILLQGAIPIHESSLIPKGTVFVSEELRHIGTFEIPPPPPPIPLDFEVRMRSLSGTPVKPQEKEPPVVRKGRWALVDPEVIEDPAESTSEVPKS